MLDDARTKAWDLMQLWQVYERKPLCDRKADILAPLVAKFIAKRGEEWLQDVKFLNFCLAELPMRGVRKFRNEIAAELLFRTTGSTKSGGYLLRNSCQA